MKRLIKNLGFSIMGATEMVTRGTNEFIFILAMPRSGSTLLTHILTSNPDIDGIGETKMKPTSFAGLQRIVGKTRYLLKQFGIPTEDNSRYILDKLVHNELLAPDDISYLEGDQFKIIFLIRNPQDTIQSLLKAMKTKKIDIAIRTYEKRARKLSQYVQQLGPQKTCLFLTYDQIINCTGPVFAAIEQYLEISQALSEDYKTTEATGKFALGDNSKNIQSGKIMRQKNEKMYRAPIPAEKLKTAQLEFEACKIAMEQYCLIIDPAVC